MVQEVEERDGEDVVGGRWSLPLRESHYSLTTTPTIKNLIFHQHRPTIIISNCEFEFLASLVF